MNKTKTFWFFATFVSLCLSVAFASWEPTAPTTKYDYGEVK